MLQPGAALRPIMAACWCEHGRGSCGGRACMGVPKSGEAVVAHHAQMAARGMASTLPVCEWQKGVAGHGAVPEDIRHQAHQAGGA